MIKRYYKTDAEDGTEIKVSVGYTLGGINYWNYETDARGYYVYVQAVVRGSGNGFTSERFTIGDGFRQLLKEVARRGKKAEAEADALAGDRADELAKRLAWRKGINLTGEVVAA